MPVNPCCKVSILARAEARALPMPELSTCCSGVVSILARAEARALRRRCGSGSARAWFQSSPAPRRGRSFGGNGVTTYPSLFQSSPAPRRGRSMRMTFLPSKCSRFQSSPAPRRGRSRWSSRLPTCAMRFNPRPRRGAGAPWGKVPFKDKQHWVSILARAEARALLDHIMPLALGGSFQSSPAPRRGRSRGTVFVCRCR